MSTVSTQAMWSFGEEHFVTLDGCRVRVCVAGHGPPLVLLHGLLGYAFSWRFNVDALSQHRTVYAIDLPGVGGSQCANGIDVSIHATAARVWSVLGALGLADVEIIASSHGGAVGLAMAVQQPHIVRSLIAISPANAASRYARWRLRMFGHPAASIIGPVLDRGILSRFNSLVLRRMYGDPRRISPGTLDGYSAVAGQRGIAPHLLRVVRTLRRDLRALDSELDRITAPVLLVWGDRDRAVDPRSADALVTRIPHAELAVMRGAGHIPYEECPEQFNRVALDFLRRVHTHLQQRASE